MSPDPVEAWDAATQARSSPVGIISLLITAGNALRAEVLRLTELVDGWQGLVMQRTEERDAARSELEKGRSK